MKRDSLLFTWYIREFSDQPSKVRAIEDLLNNGHTGLAESAVVKSLQTKYRKAEGKIKVQSYGQTSWV